MQGIMFIELARFIDDRQGAGAWHDIVRDTGLASRHYEPQTSTPDEEFERLAAFAAGRAGEPMQSFLEAFGAFVAPDLLGGLYGLLVRPEWDILGFLEHTEEAIHTVIRARDATAGPPHLAGEAA